MAWVGGPMSTWPQEQQRYHDTTEETNRAQGQMVGNFLPRGFLASSAALQHSLRGRLKGIFAKYSRVPWPVVILPWVFLWEKYSLVPSA